MLSMEDVKKRLIISMIAIVMLVLTLFGITYAYFTAKIKNNDKDVSSKVSAGMLKLKYLDGNGYIDVTGIKPDTTIKSKTFTVQNVGTGLVENYDVILESVVNELEYYEDLTYVLECSSSDSNACVGGEGIFPKSQQVIATNSIDVGTIHTYILTLTYKETETDQSNDMNKTISAKVNIKDDMSSYKKLIVYGNSIQETTPSLTTPVEVKSLGEKTKNLFDESLLSQEVGYNVYEEGLWTTSNLGLYGRSIFYNVTGVGHNVNKTKVLKVNPNSTISIKFYDYDTNITSGTHTLFYGYYDKDGIFISRNTFNPNEVLTITIPENVYYLDFFRTTNSGTITFSKIQIEENNKATSYEPYGYKIPITFSRNLLDDDYSKVEKGGYAYVPITTDDKLLTMHITDKDPSIILDKSIAFGFTVNGTNATAGYKWAVFKDWENTIIYNNVNNVGKEVDPPMKYFSVYPNNEATWNVIFQKYDIKIYEGILTEKEVLEFKEQTDYIYTSEPLRKIGNYADYIDFENRQRINYIGKMILTGTESLTLHKTFSDGSISVRLLNGGAANVKANINPISTHQTGVGFYNYYTLSEPGVATHSTSNNVLYMHIPDATLNSVTTYKNYFAKKFNEGNPIILYYVQLTPTIETIDVPTIDFNSSYDITSCSSNNVCASNIEVEYD